MSERILCRCLNPREWNRFVDSLKPFIRNDSSRANSYIYINSSSNTTITGMACDGYRLAKQTLPTVIVEESFSICIRPPRLRALPNDSVIDIIQMDDDTIAVCFGDVRFLTKQPEAKMDCAQLYEAVNDNRHIHIGLNRRYLRDAAISLYDGNDQSPIILSTSGNPLKAVKFSKGNSERFILPVRIKPSEV